MNKSINEWKQANQLWQRAERECRRAARGGAAREAALESRRATRLRTARARANARSRARPARRALPRSPHCPLAKGACRVRHFPESLDHHTHNQGWKPKIKWVSILLSIISKFRFWISISISIISKLTSLFISIIRYNIEIGFSSIAIIRYSKNHLKQFWYFDYIGIRILIFQPCIQ